MTSSSSLHLYGTGFAARAGTTVTRPSLGPRAHGRTCRRAPSTGRGGLRHRAAAPRGLCGGRSRDHGRGGRHGRPAAAPPAGVGPAARAAAPLLPPRGQLGRPDRVRHPGLRVRAPGHEPRRLRAGGGVGARRLGPLRRRGLRGRGRAVAGRAPAPGRRRPAPTPGPYPRTGRTPRRGTPRRWYGRPAARWSCWSPAWSSWWRSPDRTVTGPPPRRQGPASRPVGSGTDRTARSHQAQSSPPPPLP